MTPAHAAPSDARHAQHAARAALPLARIAVGVDDPRADLALSTVCLGCWSPMLGAFPLPDDAALDRLAAWIERHPEPPARVELVGDPAACLLPLLWLRTIWLGPDADVRLVWPRVREPGADQREALAARLACSLAAGVVCDDPDAAERLWGICPSDPSPALDAFDLVLGLIDSWDIRRRNADAIFPQEWLARARKAMEACAESGARRVALYGAGTHTRALGPLLMEPRVPIACIIDDNPAMHGRSLWGYPVVPQSRALELGVDAVILSANSFEDRLWENSAPLRERGVRVIRLYADGAAPAAPLASPLADSRPAAPQPAPARTPIARITRAAHAPEPDATSAIFAFLALPAGADNFWGAVDTAARASGSPVFGVAAHLETPTSPLTGVAGSFATCALLGRDYPDRAPLAEPLPTPLLRRCLASDLTYWRSADGLAPLVERGARAAAWIVERAVAFLNPRAAVVWNAASSASAVAEHTLRRLGVPVLHAERGAFSPTVFLDRVGPGCISELTTDPAWRARLQAPAKADETRAGRAIADHLRALRAENRAARAPGTSAVQPGSLRGRGVAFFGSIEPGLEWAPAERWNDLGAPFGDSARACEALLSACARVAPGARVFVKPHPHDPAPGRFTALAQAAGAAPADGLSVHDAIDAGCVIATTSASVAWLALACGAPVLPLTRQGFAGLGVSFDAENERDLPEALAAALRDDAPASRVDRALAVVARYAQGYCCTADPALQRLGVPGPEEALRRILAHARAPVAPARPEAWLDELRRANVSHAG